MSVHDEMQEPSEEELRAALEEQMRQLRVEDVVFQTVATLVNLAGRRLGLAGAAGEEPSEERDLDQARSAIDAVRALVPMCPPEQAEAVRQALSQLQMAFAREAQGAAGATALGDDPGVPGAAQPAGAGTVGASPPAAGAPEPQEGQAAEDAERAKARAKIWTPPGA